MSQIQVSNLTFGYEGSYDYIFEELSLVLDTDWKLGFIGRNGKGKTTFLDLLMGRYPYRGSISSSVVFDYFPYKVTQQQRKRCAGEFLEELRPDCEMWRVIMELEKLHLDAQVLYRPFETLSFGERTKVMLALLFSEEGHFLLIDEPTNHLDAQSRENVKEYLKEKKGFILVSHDRELLDSCVDHVLVLNRSTITVEKGNFSSWWENKTRRDQFERQENEKHLREIGKLREASRRASGWASKNEGTKIGYDPVKDHDRGNGTRPYIGAKTKKMQRRVKQIEERISREIDAREGLLKDLESPIDLKLMPQSHHKEVYLRFRDFSLSYGEDTPVFEHLDLELKRGERLLLQGENGCGKSSLIRAILEEAGGTTPTGQVRKSGLLEVASGLKISYVNQDTSFLRGDLEAYAEECGIEEHMLKAILRQLDFDRVQFDKKMEEYSQGQKKKVLIAASLLTGAHLYIWDEPLNYIDVFSRMQLEKLILKVKPTMLLVEHDPVFGERVATGVYEMSENLLVLSQERWNRRSL